MSVGPEYWVDLIVKAGAGVVALACILWGWQRSVRRAEGREDRLLQVVLRGDGNGTHGLEGITAQLKDISDEQVVIRTAIVGINKTINGLSDRVTSVEEAVGSLKCKTERVDCDSAVYGVTP